MYVIRKALPSEVDAIARLNNTFADRALMLRRTPEVIAAAIDDYVVAVNDRSEVIACGALKEYSASLAEVAAIAVAHDAQGQGLGKAIVAAVEALARQRGIPEVFALTLEPRFFETLGYERVDRSRYPEKIARDCVGCARRFLCNEFCYVKLLGNVARPSLIAAAAAA